MNPADEVAVAPSTSTSNFDWTKCPAKVIGHNNIIGFLPGNWPVPQLLFLFNNGNKLLFPKLYS